MSITSTNTIHIRYELLISWFEWALFVLAIVLYIYCIAMTVVQVVLRQELVVSIQEAETRVSELEADYFERSNKISREMADEYGLVAVSAPVYITVVPEGDRLTRNE
jgi:hypothetical protein